MSFVTPPEALAGVTVIDFSRVLAGPYATMMLADLGASVIKVERPGVGDDTRSWLPPVDENGGSTYFASVNRNKESIAIDLASADGRAKARELVAGADVVIENFRDGTMDRLGIGYRELARTDPSLIYCSITGFGTAAGGTLPGYDLLVQAAGGLMSITGPAPGAPTKTGVAVIDVITGMHASFGILAALRHRDRTGDGQRIEVDLLSSGLSALVNQSGGYLQGGVVPGILGNAHPSIAPYETFMASDAEMALAVGNDRQYRALAEVVGDQRLLAPSFASNADRVAHRAELRRILAEDLSRDSAARWSARLTAAGVPASRLNNVAQAFDFAEELGLEPVVQIDGARYVRNPIRMSKTPARYRHGVPELDAHRGADGDAGIPQ